MEKVRTAGKRPVLALTGGDPNGIGPEICLKAVRSPAVRSVCRPVLVGDPAVFEYYRKKYRIGITLREASAGEPLQAGRTVPVIGIQGPRGFRPTPGALTRSGGLVAGRSLELGISLCRDGITDALVTGPLSKSNLNAAGFPFPGQTEMIARYSRSGPPLMLLINGDFRVALVTAHVPLRRVPPLLTVERVARTISAFHDALVADFRVRRPSIAVLALNPHAGEGGLLGSEEEGIIVPAIRSVKRRVPGVSGPFPADGFFGNRSGDSFDGIVAMYHDQGLIPVKILGFSPVVNVTAGLPIVRTSPGHGTARDIAGAGKADPSSMISAVLTALTIAGNRRGHAGRGRRR